ncbi:MAG: hypothetical protein KF787_11970 [Phycisphaeraceae bacterium]|nr:hypothetical protein [Phycisphaerae bacterium]MBX3393352.1 hypothetical protein [Phycisphaeraceae bacterium]HRJ49788.1 hypothetical protein [Phycisphaerales bacterium]
MNGIRLAGLTVVFATLAIVGCQATKTPDDENCRPAVPGAAPEPGMINAACPVMSNEDARSTGASVAYTGGRADWSGKHVALCCKGCIPRWQEMSSSEQEAALVRVTSR